MIKTLTATLFASAYAVKFAIPWKVYYYPGLSVEDACVGAEGFKQKWSCGLAYRVAKEQYEMAEEGSETSEAEEGSEESETELAQVQAQEEFFDFDHPLFC